MEEPSPAANLRRRSHASTPGGGSNYSEPAPDPQAPRLQVPTIHGTATFQGYDLHTKAIDASSEHVNATPLTDLSQTASDAGDSQFFEAPNPDYDDRNTTIDRKLGSWDVLALVFNKMVGTGIFATPALVLALTGSPVVSIVMWLAGGVYTAISLLLYLEYGTRYPYNGGELIYLDRIFRPGLLFTVFFAAYNLCLGNTTGNAVQFGQYVTISAIGTPPTQEFDANSVDERIVKLISWCALTLACAVLYLLPTFGMFLNKSLALFKIVLLIIVFAKGIEYSHGQDSGRPDFSRSGNHSFINNMSAMIFVIYSYTGWENGNYVAGEIRDLPDSRGSTKLLKGAMSAVFLTTVLYVLVVLAYYLSTDYNSIVNNMPLLGMGADFGPKVFGGNGQTLNIMIAVSAFGNLIAVVYTSAKIKQAIARQRFIPFWHLIEKDNTLQSNVPRGGLVLHWITTTIWIAALPIDRDGYSFVIGISTYGRLIIETAVFGGLLLFSYYHYYHGMRSFEILRHMSLQVLLPSIMILFNGVILVLSAMEVEKLAIPRYWWPAAMGMLFLGSFLYWGVIKLFQLPLAMNRPSETTGNTGIEMGQRVNNSTEALHPHGNHPTLGARIGLEIRTWQWTEEREDQLWPERLQAAMAQSSADGSLRRVDAQITREIPHWMQKAYTATRRSILRTMF